MRKLWKRAAALVVSAALAGAMLPSAFSEEATDAVEAKLTTMTLREKVGQLFWVRPETLDFSLNPEKKTLTQTMRQNLEQYPVGGIAVFKKNIQDENQLSSLIADFQSASKIPMIVAVDEEGGAVARLANHEAFSLPKYTSARDALHGKAFSGPWGYRTGQPLRNSDILQDLGRNESDGDASL